MNVYQVDIKGIVKKSYYIEADSEDEAKDLVVEKFIADINNIDILNDEFSLDNDEINDIFYGKKSAFF